MVIEGNSRKNVLERQQTAVRDTCSRKRPDDFSQQLGPRPRSWPIMTLSSLNCFGGRTTKRTRRRARSASLDLLCSAEDREPGHQSIFYTQLTSPLDTLLRPHGVEEEGEAAVLIRNSLNTLQQSRPPRGSNLSNEPGDRVGTAQSDSDESGYRVGSAQSDSSNKEGLCLGVALCDNNPSPYDREGLPFRAGDRIQILTMNPNGLWRGRVHGREGIFKFIRVKLLHEGGQRRHSLDCHPTSTRADHYDVGNILSEAHLEYLAPLLILNGFDSVSDVMAITEDDLGYLGITGDEQKRILEAVSDRIYGSSSKNRGKAVQLAQKVPKERTQQPRPSLYNRFSWHPSYAKLLDEPLKRPVSAEVGGLNNHRWLHHYKRKSSQNVRGFGPLVLEDGAKES